MACPVRERREDFQLDIREGVMGLLLGYCMLFFCICLKYLSCWIIRKIARRSRGAKCFCFLANLYYFETL